MKRKIITVTLITGLSITAILSTPLSVQASTYRNFLQNYVSNQQTVPTNNSTPVQPSTTTPAPSTQNNNLGDFWTNRRSRISTPPTTTAQDPAPQHSQPTQQNPAPTPAPQPQVSPQPSANHTVSQREMEMLSRINEERAKVGVAPLQIDVEVSKWARIKSQDMKDLNYFAHNSPTYGTPFEMMRNAGISYRRAAENISASQSPYISHLRLMASTGHKNNILNPNFTHVGIGIVDQNSSGVLVTQLFIQK
ncbi:serine protease [Alkalicella caledoniensis]|uniref:Serine protease n=1 Tax=Alkalicella caledoniensis TaxID=2731377 RepID=A0A7G9W6V7_ALKCA|nr:CAP domain-containing protein [Alkalicella caledoniensis]QNO14419.1 serine protease [Alkalicella caledoniensis]